MPSALPDGEPAPRDGSLPASSCAGLGDRPFGVYLHVPFCATRCGYCDFNTYTADRAGRRRRRRPSYAGTRDRRGPAGPPGARRRRPAGARRCSSAAARRPCCRRPTSARLLAAVRDEFGLAAGAEVTTEANPDSVDAGVAGGAARGRLHPGLVRHAVGGAARARHPRPHPRPGPGRRRSSPGRGRPGFERVSLDLIYGTPGESLDDWRRQPRRGARAASPTTSRPTRSIVEDGTRLAGRVRRGELPAPDDDDLADKYVLADEVLAAAGFGWYEVSNWARGERPRCRHNLGYWRGDDWWGVGPGAHSHVGGVRWWNVRHPAAYAGRLAAGDSPAAGARGARRRSSGASSGCCSGSGSREGLPARPTSPTAGRAGRRPRGRRRPARPGRAGRRPRGADAARPAARRRRGARPARLSRPWLVSAGRSRPAGPADAGRGRSAR